MALTIECPRTFFTLKNYKFAGTPIDWREARGGPLAFTPYTLHSTLRLWRRRRGGRR